MSKGGGSTSVHMCIILMHILFSATHCSVIGGLPCPHARMHLYQVLLPSNQRCLRVGLSEHIEQAWVTVISWQKEKKKKKGCKLAIVNIFQGAFARFTPCSQP